VVGGGTMGVGIAYVLASHGISTFIVEPDSERRSGITSTIDEICSAGVLRGKLNSREAEQILSRVQPIGSLSECTGVLDVAIEAVPENIELKRAVLREMENLDPHLLGTNTSSISIDVLAAGLARPDALVGVHFFNPVWVNALVEIVVGQRTRPECVSSAQDLARLLGKEAITVADRPGFASSRLGVLLGLEAIRMVEEGVASVADIDRAMEIGYRHPMGPLRLTDLVGLDVRLSIARNLEATFGDRFSPPALLEEMVARGDVGKKSGKGFYEW
jgi:3-hydroxybutyryl-CoA dehydrogenase